MDLYNITLTRGSIVTDNKHKGEAKAFYFYEKYFAISISL